MSEAGEIDIKYLLPPDAEAMIARYDSIIREIYTKASEEMVGVSQRNQSHIHRYAIEQARPFVEEVARIRAQALPSVVISSELAAELAQKEKQ